MIRAFFSYSTEDEEFVRSVSDRIGRPFVHIDYKSFSSGKDILAAVNESIDDSALFVLFLSRSSLKSAWVRHEIGEAQFQIAMGRIKHSLVVRMDQRISVSDIPEWLNRSKHITSQATPPVVRKINSLLDDLVRQSQTSLFVGRSSETLELQEAFSRPENPSLPQAVCISGLLGIGRKSTLSDMARRSLNLENIVAVDVEPGDTLQALAIKLSAQVDPAETAERAKEIACKIELLPDVDALNVLVEKLKSIVNFREMPVFYDSGGLLDDDGNVTPYILDVLDSLRGNPDILMALLTNRRPARESLLLRAIDLPVIQIRQLPDADVSVLVSLMARSRRIAVEPEIVRKIVSAVRGYPPSVTYALELVRAYGADIVLGSNRMLADFGAAPFIKYLRDSSISELERGILKVISGNSPLPLSVLSTVLEVDEERIGEALVRLIDVSLIIPTQTGWYEASGPVASAIEREYGTCNREEYKAVASALGDFLKGSVDQFDYLALQRTLFRALNLAGEGSSQLAYAFTADWLRVAGHYYHRKHDYEKAAQTARLIVESRPQLTEARTLLIQSLVKLGHYSEAEGNISEFTQNGLFRDAFFLLGFLERYRGNHRLAIKNYQRALDHRRGGMAIHRDMAACYLQLGDLDRANQHISIAQEKQPDNKFLIDLKIQIACRRGDRKTARNLLLLLADVESRMFTSHRAARVEYFFGAKDTAYEFAKMAVSESDHPPFEILANYALCAIRTDHYPEASDALSLLDRSYGGQKSDIRLGLHARLAIVEGRYEEALGYANKLSQPDNPVHLTIKRDALRGILENAPLTPGKRNEFEDLVGGLERRISDHEEDFDFDSR
ncbi:TIR domain-containing protein [Streptomyces sp. NBC_01613]|uniref:tetratricopeptide repeat protein n=1 Tax=Streptomyces sp. NBC_01613 TaxID=2975896 RepID=UPI003863B7C7